MRRTILAFCLLAAVATAALTPTYSSASYPRHWANLPLGLIDYFVAMDQWLVGIFWKWIMYGTWYVLGEQIYCNFFPSIVADLLGGVALGPITLTVTLTDAELKTACLKYFWVWYGPQFYEGSYLERPVGGLA